MGYGVPIILAGILLISLAVTLTYKHTSIKHEHTDHLSLPLESNMETTHKGSSFFFAGLNTFTRMLVTILPRLTPQENLTSTKRAI